MNPTTLMMLFFNTQEEGHTMELMDWIGAGILYFNRNGKLPPIPEIEGPKPLYVAVLTGRCFTRDQNGEKIGVLVDGDTVGVWEKARKIGGYDDRITIDPPNAGVRRNIYAANVRRL